jgi:hypothetical protein
MANTTLGYGLLLTLIGVFGYLGSGRVSPTALIPAAIGTLLLVCGVLAKREKTRMHAIHAALVIALLAILGTVTGVWALIKWGLGTPPQFPMAVLARVATLVLSVGYLVLGIRSFRAARLAREAAAGKAS